MAGVEMTVAEPLPAEHQRVLNSGGLLIPSLHRITVTVMNSILTFRNNHAIITLIVTVFSLEDKVSVLQSVKWRHCAVWHFFCFLPAECGLKYIILTAGKGLQKGVLYYAENDHHRGRRVEGL